MKKLIGLLAVAAILFTATACGTNSSTKNTDTKTSGSVQTEATADDQTTTTDQSSADNKIDGDWKYEGTVGDGTYEVNLDLEGQQGFTLEVDREGMDESADSEVMGTYTVDGNTLTLNVHSVANYNGYFTDSVKSNSTLEFEYVLSDTSLTLKNVSSTINSFPDELVLYRD